MYGEKEGVTASDEMMKQLADLIDRQLDNAEPELRNDLTMEAQEKLIREFIGQDVSKFKVGTRVRLNKFGKNRYRIPDNVVCIISAVPSEPFLDDDTELCHGWVSVAHEGRPASDGPVVVSKPLDFRCLEIVE